MDPLELYHKLGKSVSFWADARDVLLAAWYIGFLAYFFGQADRVEKAERTARLKGMSDQLAFLKQQGRLLKANNIHGQPCPYVEDDDPAERIQNEHPRS